MRVCQFRHSRTEQKIFYIRFGLLSSVFFFFLYFAADIFSAPWHPLSVAAVLFVHTGVLFVHIRCLRLFHLIS